MTLETIVANITEQAANISPIGSKVKFQLDDQVLVVDGTGDSNAVSTEDSEADCVISTSMDTFMKLKNGDINPMMAVMTGKIKIKGDMSVAMKLQSLLS